MRSRLVIISILLSLASLLNVRAETIFSTGFTTPADFEDNFVALKPAGEAELVQDAHVAGLGLRKTGPGTLSVIFDTSAQGGKGGHAGVTGSAANATFENVEIATSVRFVDFNAPGLGFWSRVPSDYTAGFMGLINVIAADQVRLRIFGSGSQPLAAIPGKTLKDVIFKPSSPLDNGTFYRAVFRTRTTPEGTHLELLILDQQGTKLAVTEVVAPMTSAPAKGQVGLRTSSKTLILDDFSVSTL